MKIKTIPTAELTKSKFSEELVKLIDVEPGQIWITASQQGPRKIINPFGGQLEIKFMVGSPVKQIKSMLELVSDQQYIKEIITYKYGQHNCYGIAILIDEIN